MSPKRLTGIKYINIKHFGPLWNLLYTHESPKTTIFSPKKHHSGWPVGFGRLSTTIFLPYYRRIIDFSILYRLILSTSIFCPQIDLEPDCQPKLDFHVRSLLISECGFMKKLKWGSVDLFLQILCTLWFILMKTTKVQNVFDQEWSGKLLRERRKKSKLISIFFCFKFLGICLDDGNDDLL